MPPPKNRLRRRGNEASRLAWYNPPEEAEFMQLPEHVLYLYDEGEWHASGGGSGGMEQHGNEWHDPDFATLGDVNSAVAAHESTYNHDLLHSNYLDHSNALDHAEVHDNTKHSAPYALDSALAAHTGAAAPHSGHMPTGAFSGLSKITVGTVAPGAPNVGDLWIDVSA